MSLRLLSGLLLLMQTGRVYLPIDMTLCEQVRVSLGQTKQDVRNALAVCCRFSNPQFPSPNGTEEYVNEITFESKDGSRSCSGTLMFDGADKLVYAQRDFAFLGSDARAPELAHAFTMALSSLLPGPSTKISGSDVKSAVAMLSANISSGPKGSQNTYFLTVGERTLRFVVNDNTTVNTFEVAEEIGDIDKWDTKSELIKK